MLLGDANQPWSPTNPDGFLVPQWVEQQAGAPVYSPPAPLGVALQYFGSNPDQLLNPDAQQALQQASTAAFTTPTPLANLGANTAAVGEFVARHAISAAGDILGGARQVLGGFSMQLLPSAGIGTLATLLLFGVAGMTLYEVLK